MRYKHANIYFQLILTDLICLCCLGGICSFTFTYWYRLVCPHMRLCDWQHYDLNIKSGLNVDSLDSQLIPNLSSNDING